MQIEREELENVQVVGLFVVIAVLCWLGAGAPQPPDGMAGCHQPSKSVPSHSRERYTRIATVRSTSQRAKPLRPTDLDGPKKEQKRMDGYKRKRNEG